MLKVATESELNTESASILFLLASVNPDQRGGELGTDGAEGISIEGDRDISVIDVSDIEVVMVGGEEGSRRKQEKRKKKKGWWWWWLDARWVSRTGPEQHSSLARTTI